MQRFKWNKSKFFLLVIILTVNPLHLFAEETDLAKSTQEIHNKLYPTVTIPFYAYGNRKLGSNNSTNQAEFQLEPRLPIPLTNQLNFIVNPQITFDVNKTTEKISNYTAPIQLATYFSKDKDNWTYGIGPYIQTPSTNSNTGTKQTGLGASYGAFYKPEHWVIGGTAYIEWGIGNNLSGGSANNLNFSPAITYITENAWSYTLNSKINSGFYQGKSSSTNQLILSGAKSYKIFNIPVQFQIGPTYWVTTTPNSPKGIGAFIGITGNYNL